MNRHNLIIIDSICIVIILSALTIKVSDFFPKSAPASAFLAAVESSVVQDPSFYDLSKNEPVVVRDISQMNKPVPPRPEISAASYLVGDILTGKIYLERNKSTVLPVASMSKLITAIASIDAYPLSTNISITETDTGVVSDTSQLSAGETLSIGELLYPLLLNSSNVAAEALSSGSDRNKFLESMSSYAWEIGMPSTFFADPSGLSPLNVSTAQDFFALAQYLYMSRKDILTITRTAQSNLSSTSDHGYHDFVNIHPFVNHPDFIGGKTGHTPAARDTMLTILEIEDRPIAIIVLASDDRKRDTDMLITSVRKLLGQ